MTGLEKIKTKIIEDAGAKAIQIEEQAAMEAQGILDQASRDTELKKTELLKKAQAESEEFCRRLLAVAELEGRKEILRAKQDMINGAFKTALEKIAGLPDREYQNVLEDMIVRAASREGGEIILSEKDAGRIDDQFINNINKRLNAMGKNLDLAVSRENVKASGGFILRNGDMEINNTFEILFGMLRPELEGEIVRTLFNEG
jgi:V/A-type H+-transporting ATPase subunit E